MGLEAFEWYKYKLRNPSQTADILVQNGSFTQR